MNEVETMLTLIPYFAQSDNIDALRNAIDKKFPPNVNREFDLGLDLLCALFHDLL